MIFFCTSFNDSGEDGLNAILRVFTKLPSLQSMDLSRNENIGPSFDFWEAKSSLSLPTPIFPSLTYLDLSGCGLDTKSCSTLLKAMGANGTDPGGGNLNVVRNLVLKFNSNDLSDRVGVKEMMNLLVKGNLVSELFLSTCQIGDQGIKLIVDECCSCSSNNPSNSVFLRRLELPHNNITSISDLANKLHPRSDDILCNGSNYFSGLRTLNLSGNPLGQSLFASMECNPEWILSLEELDLSHTSCEVSGAVELIRRCNRRDSVLKKLSLFGNEMKSEGFLALSKVLHGGHLSLEYLDLGGNGAQESAVVTLVEVLKNTMEHEDEKVEEHVFVPKGENRLQVLVVGGNTGGPALEKAIKEVQKVHPSIDIARDKPKKNNSGMPGGNMINSTPGTSWMS